MDYFQAVQEGRARVQDAVNLLHEITGQCYPLFFLKVGSGAWTPVGEEKLYSIILGKSGTAALVICDAEGNSKAMTAWVPAATAEEHARLLGSKGLVKFEGEVKLPT